MTQVKMSGHNSYKIDLEPLYFSTFDGKTLEEDSGFDLFEGNEENVPVNSVPSFQMTREQEEAMRQVLQTPMLLDLIIGNLDYGKFLKNSRLVAINWFVLATTIMDRKDCVRVKISYDAESKCFYREDVIRYNNSHELQPHLRLSALDEILEGSSLFPCRHFEISERGGNFNSVDMQKFLQLHGENIKTLHLYGTDNDKGSITRRSVFKLILFTQLPKLESLKLFNFDYDWSNDKDGKKLSSLKDFEWKNCPRTALKIIKSAPKLELVQPRAFSRKELKLLVNSRKAGVLQVQKFKMFDEVTFTTLKYFANAHGQVRNFVLGIDSLSETVSEYSDAIQNLFESSKENLEDLDLGGKMWRACQVKFPTLSFLKKLSLGDSRFKAGPCLPPQTNLKVAFPNLVTLDCSQLDSGEDKSWDEHFPMDKMRGTLPSVSKIIISENCTGNWMRRLLVVCPNFTILKIVTPGFANRFRATLFNVFREWKHLEVIEVKTEEVMLKYFNLDSVMTGISEKTSKRILEHPETVTAEDYDRDKNWPCIRDLPKLKLLRIVVDTSDDNQPSAPSLANRKPLKWPCPFSELTALYAFKLMTQLKFSVHLDYRSNLAQGILDAFQPLVPFVNFVYDRE